MNSYLKVRWIHAHADEPVLLLSELDRARREVRKVEVFADGSMGYACGDGSVRGTQLGEVPVPSEADIGADPQFIVEETSGDEFERVWTAAQLNKRN